MSISLVGPINTGKAVGADGAATIHAASPSPIRGKVEAIYVKYNGDKPATTDLTIKTVGTAPNAPTYNMLVLTDANTDGWFYPRAQVHTTAGAAIAGEYTPLYVHDCIDVAIAQANTDDSVDVWMLVEPGC